MRKVIVCVVGLFLLGGCSWFVPGQVKRQTALNVLDVRQAIVDLTAAPDSETKKVALSSLRRVEKGVVVVDDYTHGRKATR